MQLEYGKTFRNKTWEYIVPIIKEYDTNFITKLTRLHIFAYGIHDYYINDNNIPTNNYLYILCNTTQKTPFIDLLTYTKTRPYYITDYTFDTNLLKSNKHIIALQIPIHYTDILTNFIQGNYTKLYTKQQINFLFNNIQKQEKQTKILTKHTTIYNEFIQKVNKEFNTKLTLSDFISEGGDLKEVELPPNLSDEVFNYHRLIHNRYTNTT